MPNPRPEKDQEIQRLLNLIKDGDTKALESLFVALYSELRGQARMHMGGMNAHTLQPTALVNEAFVRIQQAGGPWVDRGHFLISASRAMRHVLVDHYRRAKSLKRDGVRLDIELDAIAQSFQERASDLIGLEEALEKLERRDPVMARVVDLRFFGGVSAEEVAELVELPLRTLEREWSATKKWLYGQLTAPE